VLRKRRDIRESNGMLEKVQCGELSNICSSPNIISVIKSRRMRWSRYVACMGKRRNTYNIVAEKDEGKETT
jgi:hypothetical protein